MKTKTIVVAGLLLCGCISQQQIQAYRAEYEQTVPTCTEGKDCEFKWAAARRWLNTNAGLRIQHYSSDYIETYKSGDYASTQLWARVVKEPVTASTYRITIEAGCNNMFGCMPEPWPAAIAFNKYVSAARVPQD